MKFKVNWKRYLIAGAVCITLPLSGVLFTGCPEEPAFDQEPMEAEPFEPDDPPVEPDEGEDMDMPEPEPEQQMDLPEPEEPPEDPMEIPDPEDPEDPDDDQELPEPVEPDGDMEIPEM